MKRIVEHCDYKYFGNRVDIYEDTNYYFCIYCDRGETEFALIDKNLDKMYPINSILNKSHIEYDFEMSGDEFTVPIVFDLDELGGHNCPIYFSRLISEAKKK